MSVNVASSEMNRSVLQFLDIEAGEVGEHDDEPGVEDVGDFLDDVDDEVEDDDWYETRHNISVALDAQMSANFDDPWGSFLSRAHRRAQKDRETPTYDDSTSSLVVQTAYDILASASWIPRKSDPNGFLWRIPVRVGYEEATTFTLFNKYIMGGTAFSGIRSILGRRNRPGAIYVEAPLAKDVVKLCENVSDLFIRGIMPIPPNDARLCLNNPPSSDPKANSWARITKSRLYKGDLAYVQNFDATTGADVLVVPRLDLSLSHPKTRPPQALLKLEDLYRRFGADAVQLDGDHFIFQFQKYHISGFCQFRTHNLSSSPVPTTTELSKFADCPLISAASVLEVIEMLANIGLRRHDPVKVIGGQLKGGFGIIRSLDDDKSIAIVAIANSDREVELPLSYLRKHFHVGDRVDVIDGIYKGRVGWVTALFQHKVILWDDHTQEEMVVTLNCVAFPCNRQVLNPLPFSPPLVHLPSKLVQDPLSFITGRQVTIVGRHIHKGYDGYIKNTLQNGSVVVETEAGLRDIVVDLHNVYNRDSSKLAPLSRTDLLQSQLPLSVSAPLPSGTSVSSSSAWHHPASNIRSVAGMTPMPTIASPGSLLHNSGTPAWDPSSRTPIYSSNTAYHPWMNFPEDPTLVFELRRTDGLSSSRIFWCWGNFARTGILNVCVDGSMEEISETLVTHVLPSDKRQRVIVIDPTDEFFCLQFRVADCGPDACLLQPWWRCCGKACYCPGVTGVEFQERAKNTENGLDVQSVRSEEKKFRQ